MKGEFKGYRLKKEFQRKDIGNAVLQIAGYIDIGSAVSTGQILNKDATDSIDKLWEAGLLEIWFEKVYEEKKLELNRWYRIKRDDGHSDMYAFVSEIKPNVWDHAIGGGINSAGEWKDKIHFHKDFTFEMLDTNEARVILKEEAERRGFLRNSRFTDLDIHKIVINSGLTSFDPMTNTFCMNGGVVFRRGQWATISKSLPVIEGYIGKDNGEYITYGCQEFLIEELKSKVFQKMSNFTLHLGDKAIYVGSEETRQIQEYVMNK